MTDSLLQMGLSNACFSVALAIVAMVVGATTKRPHVAHVLWLLVFVKLVTPPLVTIPVVTIPEQPEAVVVINDHSRPVPPVAGAHEFDVSRSRPPVPGGREFDVAEQPDASLPARIGSVVFSQGKVWLPPIWLLGSVVVLAWSLVRVCRFGRLLAAESEVAPQQLQAAAVKIARRLELKTIPTICTTSARLSPMVWWIGGKVRIVIPTTLFGQMDEKQWQWILAHELAHVRRRDYLVRWLEWLTCVCFWWNPVVWWARRNLRATEEICCDALVLSCLKPTRRSYATSLLTAVEFLTCPALRPPAMASEINSGGFLERRFRMIVSETPIRVNSPWLQACVLLCAMVVLPFGLASAQDYDAVAKRLGQAVEHRELTEPQADAMLATLKKMAQKTAEKDELGAYFEKVWAKLQAAVKQGKMSAEDADAKMIAIKKAKLDAGKKDAYYKAIGEKIEEAVKAGKLTEEEARAKWAAIKKAADAKKDQGSDRAKAYLMKVKKELGAAIEAGRISKEDAAKRYEGAEKAIKERMAAGRDRTRAREGQETDRAREYLMRVRKELGELVEAGKISEEAAKMRYQHAEKAIRERMAAARSERGSKRMTREDLGRAGVEIRKAVAEGKISAEDGRAKMAAMRKMIGQQSEGAARKIDWEGIKRRIEGAVKSGKMTREEADAAYKGIRERIGQRSEGDAKKGDTRNPWEGIRRRIEGAVKRGDMTREEADAKYREIRERMAAPRGR